MIYYLKGNYCDQGASLHHTDRGFLLGDGIFETVLIKKGVPVFFQEHLNRLNHACDDLKIPYHLDLQTAVEIFQQLTVRNNLDSGDHSMRITVSRGRGDRGLLFHTENGSPTCLITIAPYVNRVKTLNTMIASYIRSSNSLSSRYKSLNYLDNVMARNEVAEKGCEEAIMLNEFGHLACGSYSNVFLLLETGKIVTPTIAQGALPGIVRSKLIKIGAEQNMEIREQGVKLDTLKKGALFFSNSLMGPIADAKLVAPKARAVFDHFKNIYWRHVDEDIEQFQLCFSINHS